MSKRVRKSTMVELVTELARIDAHGLQAVQLQEIINEAQAGEYHDYKNKKYPCGKVAVVDKLRRLKLPEADKLALAVINGDYDEEADESDKEMMRSELPESAWPIFGLEKR